MTMKLKALDLFCGAGGASMGLHRAGFDVTGVDIEPQPRYPFRFIQADALEFDIAGYDFIWAGPVCKRYSALIHYGTNRTAGKRAKWPDQIPSVRRKLKAAGIPYVIENVQRSPLETDAFLCGQMFGLRLIRHRLFESSFHWLRPYHVCAPRGSTRLPLDDPRRIFSIVGNGGGIVNASVSNQGMYWTKAIAQEALGIDWMTRAEMSQSIPPAYSEFIARQFLGGVNG